MLQQKFYREVSKWTTTRDIQKHWFVIKKESNYANADKRKYLRDKTEEYMSRAETVKEIVKTLKEEGNYNEQLKIADNSCNHSYEKIFGRFLDNEVTEIKIEDPYIRTFHQVQNLVRFAELAIKQCKNLKSIHLLTSKDTNGNESKEQETWFSMIQGSLRKQHINLIISFSETLHDRQVRLSNGWIIKIGRGLDYFKPPDNKFSVGVFDLDYRPCHETIVNIFHENNVKITDS